MDYGIYKLSKGDICKYSFLYLGIFFVLGYLFYGTPLAGLFGIAAIPFLLKREAEKKRKQREQELLRQFKEWILSFANCLKAGYSIENAMREAYKELQYLFDPEDLIMVECRQMVGKMQNNHSLEELLADFGERSHTEDIRDFSEVFSVAKKSGGNLSLILSDTANRIAERMTESEQIELLFEAKRYEQKIMNVVPVFIMFYIGISNPGYFEPLYKNPVGIVVMSVCLMVYAFAYFWAYRIMKIEI